jgi:hypothetical protein
MAYEFLLLWWLSSLLILCSCSLASIKIQVQSRIGSREFLGDV